MESKPEEKVREVHGYQCMFCGEIYERKEDAEACWERHINFQVEWSPYLDEDGYPLELLLKKIEGLQCVEVVTYEIKKKEKVNFPARIEHEESR